MKTQSPEELNSPSKKLTLIENTPVEERAPSESAIAINDSVEVTGRLNESNFTRSQLRLYAIKPTLYERNTEILGPVRNFDPRERESGEKQLRGSCIVYFCISHRATEKVFRY